MDSFWDLSIWDLSITYINYIHEKTYITFCVFLRKLITNTTYWDGPPSRDTIGIPPPLLGKFRVDQPKSSPIAYCYTVSYHL